MEHSGAIREAMRKRGIDAWSCDFLPSDDNSPFHIQGDVFDEIKTGKYDAAIFHPSCTYLTCSGEKWFSGDADKYNPKPGVLWGAGRREARLQAISEFKMLEILGKKYLKAYAIENPVGVISSQHRKPDMTVQPYNFGEDASKRTCFWVHNLPTLSGTEYVPPRIVGGMKRWANQSACGADATPPGPDRWKARSKTFQGIADAIADQWGIWLETAPIQQELFA